LPSSCAGCQASTTDKKHDKKSELNPKPLPREAHNLFMLREADSPFH